MGGNNEVSLEIRKQLILLEKAVEVKDTKTCGVVARNFKRIRAEFSLKDVGLVYDHYLPEISAMMNLPKYDLDIVKFDVDEKLHLSKERAGILAFTIEAK